VVDLVVQAQGISPQQDRISGRLVVLDVWMRPGMVGGLLPSVKSGCVWPGSWHCHAQRLV
jgi:hypothetical protein